MERFAHGGDIYNEARDWLDFSANINPLGLSEMARKSILENIENIVNYPDPRAAELMEAVSEHYNIEKSSIILGNGASELIYLFFSYMRFKRVLIVSPAFSDYERAAMAAGANIDFLFMSPEDNFTFPWDKVKQIACGYDCIAIGSPNNPTGTLVEINDIKIFLDIKNSPYVFIDESFLDFRRDKEIYETLSFASEHKKIFAIRSLTKFYALPGLRLGFGVGNKNLITKLNLAKDIWNVNYLAAKAGTASLQDEDYKQRTMDLIEKERVFLFEELQNLNIKVFPPTANFLLCAFEDVNTAEKIRERLRIDGILVRNCENYPGLDGRYVRIAVKKHKENEKLITVLKGHKELIKKGRLNNDKNCIYSSWRDGVEYFGQISGAD